MNKYYVDVGAYDGDSIICFLENDFHFKTRNDPNDYKIIAIEPEAEYHQLSAKFPNVEVIAKAAWTTDGEIGYFFSNSQSSHIEDKSEKKIICFDFPQFILNLDCDYLVLKLDIEGAEYSILPKLIETQAILKINELYLEWHAFSSSREYDDKQLIKIRTDFEKYVCNIDIHYSSFWF